MQSAFHTHTEFSDGSTCHEDYIIEAIKQGMTAYGFSDHAPVDFPSMWHMAKHELTEYLEVINKLKEQYKGQIEIYAGLEVDYIPNKISPKSKFIQETNLDYTVGAVHFVGEGEHNQPWAVDGQIGEFEKGLKEIYNNDIKKVVKKYYQLVRQMVISGDPTMVAHLDLVKMHNKNNKYFNETEDWYQEEVLMTLNVIQEAPIMMEVNTRGLYKKRTTDLYPSLWILKEAKKRNIPIVINSDAHQPSEVTQAYDIAVKNLKEAGYTEHTTLKGGKWVSVAL